MKSCKPLFFVKINKSKIFEKELSLKYLTACEKNGVCDHFKLIAITVASFLDERKFNKNLVKKHADHIIIGTMPLTDNLNSAHF